MKRPPIDPSATEPHDGGIDAEERVLRGDLQMAAMVRAAPLPTLPADFSRNVASRARDAVAGDAGRVEQSLIAALAAVLVVAAARYGVSQGGSWLTPLVEMLPDASTLVWLAAAGACVGMNWLLGRLPAAAGRALPQA